MARPLTLTKKRKVTQPDGSIKTFRIMDVIVEAKRSGLTNELAANFAGVTATTFYRWMEKGREDQGAAPPRESPHRELCESLEKAESDRIAESLIRIRKAGQGGAVTERTSVTTESSDGTETTTIKEKTALPAWQADAWFLERTRPDLYGQRVRAEVSPGGGSDASGASWLDIINAVHEFRSKSPKEK